MLVAVSPLRDGEVEAVFGLIVTIITVCASAATDYGDADFAPDLRGGWGRRGGRETRHGLGGQLNGGWQLEVG